MDFVGVSRRQNESGVLDASAYQGEYEGMLQWLETEKFFAAVSV